MPSADNKLASFNHIDITIGLKYLNENKALYLKILNNFLLRYQDINPSNLDKETLNNTIHSIKGLSATLGMSELSSSAMKLETEYSQQYLSNFCIQLNEVIDELKYLFSQTKEPLHSTILIVEDDKENIDELIDILEEYDVLVAINRYEALEILDQEEIHFVLLNSQLHNSSGKEIFDFLKKHTNINNIPHIFIDIPFHEDELKAEIKEKLNI